MAYKRFSFISPILRYFKQQNMGTIHLAKGSCMPPKERGKLRLYSMKFCPFVQRARLVLIAKNLPHDIVNVHLQNKPEWIWELHPDGKVPVLDTGTKIIPESVDICEYLEEVYPQPAVYSKNPLLRAKDNQMIEEFSKEHLKLFYRLLFNRSGLTLKEHMKNVTPVLEGYAHELSKRGNFFGGSQPGIVDYMIWPWIERVALIPILYDSQKIDLPQNLQDQLLSWYKRMLEHPVVKPTVLPVEMHYKFVRQFVSGTIDYDGI